MILLMNVDKDNPSVAEGESVQIQGAGLTGFEPKGNTEQTTYSGKNLLAYTSYGEAKQGITTTYNSEDGALILNGTANNTFSNLTNESSIDIATGTYTFSIKEAKNYNIRLAITCTDNTTINATINKGSTSTTFNVNKATLNQRIFIYENDTLSGTTFTNEKIYAQLESGSTATSYEPYCGGTPSPNPDYPQPVKVVTGDNTINVHGKNLAKSFVNGELLNRYRPSLYVEADFEVGKKYAISFVDKSVGNSYYRNEYLMQNVPLYSITATGERQTYYFECKSNDKTNSSLYVEGKGFDIFKNDAVLEQLPQFEDIQIEEVTSYDIPSTPYEPYQSQEYSLNLGSIELCKIGSYQDYIYKENNKWYKHSEIGKVVLDGSEDWMLRSDVSQTSGYYTFRNNDYVEGEFNTNSNGYSNYFGVRTSTSTTTNHIRLLNATGYGTQICIDGSIAQTSQALKTWLSTNNVEVYYIKITPTNTEITDTELKEDLEAISNIALFEGVNNISMESSNLTSSFKVYYDTWYEFDKILRNGYNIREDRDRITQKFANGHRKQFVSDYIDCSITLNLDTIDKDTTQDYLQRLKSGAYKYYSIDGKEYRTAQFIIENKPELSVENSISNNVDVNEYQITLLKAGD